MHDANARHYFIKHKASSRVLISDSNGNVTTVVVENATLEKDASSLWVMKRTSSRKLNTVHPVAFDDLYLGISSDNSHVIPKCLKDSNISDLTQLDEHCPATVEYLTGELCFFTSLEHDKRMSCSPYGKLSMSRNWKGWEVFRIIEVGNGVHVRIASWTHDTKVLCYNIDGNAFMSDNDFGMQGRWTVELMPAPNNGVVIKSALFGKYLTFDGKSFATSGCISKTAAWDLSSAHKQAYFLSSTPHNKRLGCDNGRGRVFCTKNRKDWEVWQIGTCDDGFISLKSNVEGGKYLSCSAEGELTISNKAEGNELWKIVESCHGGIFIESKNHEWYLACNGEGQGIYASKDAHGEESWLLQPKMPSTISGKEITGYSVGGAVALGSIVAMPFAVMGVVGAMGFTGSGIAGGSVAAGMMSAEAISLGGGIAAGGTVATLQSIGAAG